MSAAIVVLVLLFRAASVRPQPRNALDLLQVLASGFWLGLATWLAGAVLQTWVPIWQTLLIGPVIVAIATVVRRHITLAHAVADFIAMALLVPLSVIPAQAELVLAAAVAFAAAGFLLDRLTSRLRPLFRTALNVVPVVLSMLIGTQVTQPGNFGSRLLKEDPLFPLRTVLVVPDAGTPVALDDGATAWLQETESDEWRGTAVVMHGNHRKGSQQPSSIALQGALVRAGFDVLAVDHPGFGASAAPGSDAPWHAWDPTRGPKAALKKRLEEHKDAQSRKTIVVGHSMGVDVALKFVADGAEVDAAYLFAGSLDRPHSPRWLDAFHRERNLPCCLPSPTMERIRDEFYGGGDRFAAALAENHADVHYVRFGIEHADVTVSREPLLEAIPPPRTVCDFSGVSHYFNTLAVRGFVLIDTRTIERTADLFTTPASGCRSDLPRSASSQRTTRR